MIGDVISRSNGGELEAIDGYVSDKGIIKETEKKDAKKKEKKLPLKYSQRSSAA
jgi:hypothetical protein